MNLANNENNGPKVEVGCWVKIKEHGDEEVETFHIGSVTRLQDNQIARDNAMGQALLGAEPGDDITVDGPAGPIQFEVLEVGTPDNS